MSSSLVLSSCLVSLLTVPENFQSNNVSSLSLSPPDENIIMPGGRESEEDESSLSTVLDSLLPFIHDQKSIVPLPIYLGKVVFEDSTSGEKAISF
jgi:hypothetical protein